MLIAMSQVETLLNSSGKAQTFILIITALVAFQFLAKLAEWFIEKYEIETKSMKREKMQTESVHMLEKEVDAIKLEIKEIKDSTAHDTEKRLQFETQVTDALKEIKYEMAKDRIDTLRERILEFGCVCHTREYSKEAYDNVLRNYDEYESLLKANNMNNGRTEMAISYIRKKYEEYMEKGFPYQQ